jgi:tetratricopeptide (TPR) repeat protein
MTRSLTSVLIGFLLAVMDLAGVRADEPIPQVGFVNIHITPCMRAKAGKGPKCELPSLPDNADTQQMVAARLSRARFYIDTGELPNAVGETDAALALDSTNADAHHLAARLAMSMHDLVRAEREIKTAIRLRPDDVDLRATDAVRLGANAWLDEAVREFDEILAKRPDHRFSREERVKLLMSLSRPDAAIADLDVLLADRQDADLLAERGAAYISTNRPQQAIEDFSEGLKQVPGRVDLLTGRAAAYELAGNDQAALADYDAILGPINEPPVIIMREGQLAAYHMARAQLLIRLKRFADASSDMMHSISAGGRRSILRAQVYLRQNGFPQTPLDGQDSPDLRAALQSCFGLNSCSEKISDNL